MGTVRNLPERIQNRRTRLVKRPVSDVETGILKQAAITEKMPARVKKSLVVSNVSIVKTM